MQLIEVPTADGTAQAHVSHSPSGSGPGVLFYMDAIGIRPQVAQMCDRIASWGYVVLAPNVYHREGDVASLAPDRDLREPGEREAFMAEALPRLQRLTPDAACSDFPAWIEALRALDGVHEGPVGVTGYCMGAALALRTATGHPDDVVAGGGFHGARLATDDPDSPHQGLGRARAEFCFGHADEDPSMPPESVATLGEALAGHGLSATNEVYPGAPHGYTMADTSAYDESSAERHYAELEALLERTLAGS